MAHSFGCSTWSVLAMTAAFLMLSSCCRSLTPKTIQEGNPQPFSVHTRTYTCTYLPTYTFPRVHTHPHTPTNTRVTTHSCPHPHMLTYIHTHAHTSTQSHTATQVHACITCAQSQTHKYTPIKHSKSLGNFSEDFRAAGRCHMTQCRPSHCPCFFFFFCLF